MRLQYRYFEYVGFRDIIELYRDGKLFKSYKVWSDELDDEINKLEEEGYSYGYTKEEIERARNMYEEMLNKAI